MEIPKRSENFSEWYNWILREARIAYVGYPVKGSFPYLERGTKVFRKIRDFVEKIHDETGHKSVLFPTLIPLSLFKRETDFFEGFTPEAYVVTETLQGRKFEEKLILRPTSEVPLYFVYSHFIRSWRDLPLKIYQIVNIFRCETKMTSPLLRLREVPGFVEAHTFHSTEEESHMQIQEAVEIYKKILDFVGLPWIMIKSPDWDLFPGAYYQYDFMTIMPNGKLLELASVINLGQKFAKAFEIRFQDKDLQWKFVYQTCYGIGIDRIIGAVIGLFSDDIGLILPPHLSPEDYVIVPIPKTENKEEVENYAKEIHKKLQEMGYKGVLDLSDETPGSKFYRYERMGIPIRIEIGEKEMKENKITTKVRGVKDRYSISLEEFPEIYEEIKEKLKKWLFQKASEEAKKLISDNGPIYLLKMENPNREELERKAEELGVEYLGKVVESNFLQLEGEYHLFGKKY